MCFFSVCAHWLWCGDRALCHLVIVHFVLSLEGRKMAVQCMWQRCW